MNPTCQACPFLPVLENLSDSMVIRRIPCQPISGRPLAAARLLSDKSGKILDFYLLLRHCLADTLQVLKMLD